MTKIINKFVGFKIGEVENLTGVSARKLRWWDKQGLVKPGVQSGCKKRQIRRYTLRDIVCILVIESLRDKGLSLQKIRRTINRIKIAGVEHPLAQLRVACLVNTLVIKDGDKFIEPMTGQLVIEHALDIIRPHFKRKNLAPIERSVERANQHFEEKMANL